VVLRRRLPTRGECCLMCLPDARCFHFFVFRTGRTCQAPSYVTIAFFFDLSEIVALISRISSLPAEAHGVTAIFFDMFYQMRVPALAAIRHSLFFCRLFFRLFSSFDSPLCFSELCVLPSGDLGRTRQTPYTNLLFPSHVCFRCFAEADLLPSGRYVRP